MAGEVKQPSPTLAGNFVHDAVCRRDDLPRGTNRRLLLRLAPLTGPHSSDYGEKHNSGRLGGADQLFLLRSPPGGTEKRPYAGAQGPNSFVPIDGEREAHYKEVMRACGPWLPMPGRPRHNRVLFSAPRPTPLAV